MTEPTLSRRNMITAGGIALAAGSAALLASPAMADQGNMDAALRQLGQALESLRRAQSNKGGNRERAIGLVEQAIAETQAGIEYARLHGGGG